MTETANGEVEGLGSSKANEHYMAGLTHVKNQNFGHAYQCFTRAIFLLPEEPILYVARAEVCVNQFDLVSAVANYKKSISLQKQPEASHRHRLAALLDSLGLLAFNRSKFDRALAFFDSAIQYTPTNKTVRLHRSLTLFMLSRHEEALRDCEICEGVEQCIPYVWIVKGVFHLMAKRFPESKASIEKCLLISSETGLVSSLEMMFETVFNRYKNEATISMEDHQWREAIVVLNNCIDTFPHDPELYRTRSRCHVALKEYTSAVQDIFDNINKSGMTTEQSSSQLSETLTLIAAELFEKGSFHQSINYCDEALKWDPDGISTLIQRAECHKAIGEHDASLRDLKRVLEIEPDHLEGLWRLSQLHSTWGMMLYNDKKFKLAEHEFTRAITYWENEPYHHINRAKCLMMMQQPAAAIREYVACWKLNPRDPTVIKLLRQVCPPEFCKQVASQTHGKTLRPLGNSGIMIAPSPPLQQSMFGRRSSKSGGNKIQKGSSYSKGFFCSGTAQISLSSSKENNSRRGLRVVNTSLSRLPIQTVRLAHDPNGTLTPLGPPKRILCDETYQQKAAPSTGDEQYTNFKKGVNTEMYDLRMEKGILCDPYGVTAIRGLVQQQHNISNEVVKAGGQKLPSVHWKGAKNGAKVESTHSYDPYHSLKISREPM